MGCLRNKRIQEKQDSQYEDQYIAYPQEMSYSIYVFILSVQGYAQLTVDFKIPQFAGSIVYEDNIYLVGGTYDQLSKKSLNQVKKIQRSGESINLPKLNVQRVGCSLLVFKECLFVVGGHNFQMTLNKVEYLPLNQSNKKSKFMNLASLNISRAFCSLVNRNNKIFAFGGSNFQEQKYLESCEYYINDEWKLINFQLPFKADCIGCFGDPFIIFGGKNILSVQKDQLLINNTGFSYKESNLEQQQLDIECEEEFQLCDSCFILSPGIKHQDWIYSWAQNQEGQKIVIAIHTFSHESKCVYALKN